MFPKAAIHLFWMKITWTKKSLLDRQEKAVNTHTQRRWQHYNFEYVSKTRKNRKFMQQVIDISSSPTSTHFLSTRTQMISVIVSMDYKLCMIIQKKGISIKHFSPEYCEGIVKSICIPYR